MGLTKLMLPYIFSSESRFLGGGHFHIRNTYIIKNKFKKENTSSTTKSSPLSKNKRTYWKIKRHSWFFLLSEQWRDQAQTPCVLSIFNTEYRSPTSPREVTGADLTSFQLGTCWNRLHFSKGNFKSWADKNCKMQESELGTRQKSPCPFHVDGSDQFPQQPS